MFPDYFGPAIDYGSPAHILQPIGTEWYPAVRNENEPFFGWEAGPNRVNGRTFQCKTCNPNNAPCLNDGLCSSELSGLSESDNRGECFCANGFRGSRCEIEPFCTTDDDCYGAGSKCNTVTGLCECDEPFRSGNICQFINETVVDCWSEAQPKFCYNGGRCAYEDGESTDECFCLKDYYGDECEFKKGPDYQDICGDKVCRNDGFCLRDTDVEFCLCFDPFYGDECQFEKNRADRTDCFGGKCLNGGICNFIGGCKCPDGYDGFFCEIVI